FRRTTRRPGFRSPRPSSATAKAFAPTSAAVVQHCSRLGSQPAKPKEIVARLGALAALSIRHISGQICLEGRKTGIGGRESRNVSGERGGVSGRWNKGKGEGRGGEEKGLARVL